MNHSALGGIALRLLQFSNFYNSMAYFTYAFCLLIAFAQALSVRRGMTNHIENCDNGSKLAFTFQVSTRKII